MFKIPLKAVPNQNLILQLDGNSWEIDISLSKNQFSLVSVKVNQEQLVNSVKVASEIPVLFSKRLARFGQLSFTCEDGSSYPNYKEFGKSHNLYWAAPNEY